MTTLTQLVDRVQLLLNDTAAAIWAQTDIEEWVCDGIRDYSIYFPRRLNTGFICVAGQQEYDLPADFLNVVTIEYPTGLTPPNYCTRLHRTHPDFWLHDGYYDILPSSAGPTFLGVLYLSRVPVAGDQLLMDYYAYHAPAYTSVPPPVGATSVPAYHEHLIEQYAVWQAHVERLNTEIQAPDTTIRLIQQYKLAVQATESSYRASIRAAAKALSVSGWTGPWRMDGHDRIY